MNTGYFVILCVVIWSPPPFMFLGTESQSRTTSTKVQVYDTVWGEWHHGPEMPSPCRLGTAATFNNKIYIMGGYTQSCMSFNPATKVNHISNSPILYAVIELDCWNYTLESGTRQPNISTILYNLLLQLHNINNEKNKVLPHYVNSICHKWHTSSYSVKPLEVNIERKMLGWQALLTEAKVLPV